MSFRHGIPLLLVSALAAQQQFEVAVIRPAASDTTTGTSFEVFEGGRVRITNEPVRLLIRAAFQLQNSQIAGGPAWMDSDRYDIEAKTGSPDKPRPGQLSPFLQSLLADRFHFKSHRETRELTVYALVAAKGGSKLKPKVEGEKSGMNTHGGKGTSQLVATATSMELLVAYVGNRLGRIVVDKTGLTDGYDFTLNWAPEEAADASQPSLVTPGATRAQAGIAEESR